MMGRLATMHPPGSSRSSIIAETSAAPGLDPRSPPPARVRPRRPNLRSRLAARLAALAVGVGLLAACGPPSLLPPPVSPTERGGIAFIGPACVGVSSCLLGHVVAAETAAPMARATIFFEREDTPEAKTEEDAEAVVRIARITDDDGVFTVVDAPAGVYRLTVYKEGRKYEVRGLELGQPGTTVVPVRLPPVRASSGA